MVGVAEDTSSVTLQTYRYLRMILVLPPVFLMLATVGEGLTRGVWRQSISDSYAGPVRDVFVGALMATGVCLIAYKSSSKLEDYALNFAGFNAFFVALVPNNFTPMLVAAPAHDPHDLGVLTQAQILDNLRVVLWAFLISAALFTFFDWRLMHWRSFRWGKDEAKFASVLVWISWAAEAVFLLAIVGAFLLFGRRTLVGDVSVFGVLHFTAAGLLIANLSFAAASHAFPLTLRSVADRAAAPPTSNRALLTYRLITGLMWAGLLIGGFCIWRQVPYSVILTEYFEIAMFLAYWLVATRRDWSNPL